MMRIYLLSLCLLFSFTCNAQSVNSKKKRTTIYTVATAGMDNFPDIMLDVVTDRNPEDDYMNLSVTESHIAARYDAELTDNSGNLIEHYYIRELFTTIPAGNLSEGTYYLRIMDGFDLIKVFIIRKEPQ